MQLEEMNAASDERVKRVEEATSTNDIILKQMFENNKRKANELLKYEARLDQIGKVSTENSSKLDKLGQVFKQFLIEMARQYNDQNGPTRKPDKNKLLAIVSLLDEDEPDTAKDMEVDAYQSDNPLNEPLPSANDVVIGRGNK